MNLKNNVYWNVISTFGYWVFLIMLGTYPIIYLFISTSILKMYIHEIPKFVVICINVAGILGVLGFIKFVKRTREKK